MITTTVSSPLAITFLHRTVQEATAGYAAALEWMKAHVRVTEAKPAAGQEGMAWVGVDLPDGSPCDFAWSRRPNDMLVHLYATGHAYEPILMASPRQAENAGRWLALMLDLWKIVTPYAGYTDEEMHCGFANRASLVTSGTKRQFDPSVATIHGFNLANLYSRDFVERFGRERLLAARERAFLVDELEDGAILVVPQSLMAGPRDRRLCDALYLLGIPPPGAEGADTDTYRALLDFFERKKSEDPDGLARDLGVDEAAMESWRRFVSKVSAYAGTDPVEVPHRALSEAPWPEFAMSVAIEVGRGTMDLNPDHEEDLEEVLRGFGEKIKEALRGGG